MFNWLNKNQARCSGSAIGLSIAALAMAGFIGCGGGSTTAPKPQPDPTPKPGTTQVQVNLGDAPADRIAAFAMTVNSLSMSSSAGSSVDILAAPATVEMMHLMGAMQPLGMVSMPQGTYTQANLVLGSAVVSYMDPGTMAMIQKTIPGPMNATITFDPPMTVGASPMILNMDMDMGASVSIDGMGNVGLMPRFSTSIGMPGTGNALDPEHGGMPHLAGAVTGISGSAFTMSTLMGARSMSFQTNASTVFQGGISGLGTMTSGMLVSVDASLQSDGSMLAARVQRMMNPGGAMAEGLISTITGTPPAKLTLIMQNGMGGGMITSALANTVTLNLTPATAYRIDPDFTDLTGLPFTPAFDAGHVYVGQRVSAVSGNAMAAGGGMMGGGGMMAGTVAATEVDLEMQGFSGTVSNYAPAGAKATFTLALPADSAFTTLTGATAVMVFQQSGTELFGMTGAANGNAIRVRGLLFFDAGKWKLVASRLMMP